MATISWYCTVCGYVHQGEAPPDCCPVCGATAEHFERMAEAPPAPPQTTPTQWRCLNCDYIHEGSTPPESCPVCGVGPDQLEPVSRSGQSVAPHEMSGTIVIIGGGIAGLSAAEAARAAAPRASIILLT
jgi:nitrite reductase (NADH) large subunit